MVKNKVLWIGNFLVPVGNFKVLPSFSDVGQQLKNITGTVSEINSVLNSRQASGNRARCPEQSFVGYAKLPNFSVGNNAYDDPKIRFVASDDETGREE